MWATTRGSMRPNELLGIRYDPVFVGWPAHQSENQPRSKSIVRDRLWRWGVCGNS